MLRFHALANNGNQIKTLASRSACLQSLTVPDLEAQQVNLPDLGLQTKHNILVEPLCLMLGEQIVLEKVTNNTSHLGKVNQNYNELSSYTCSNN